MRRHVLFSAAVMVTASALFGQTKTGTSVGQFLLIEPSARSAAMGGAGVTMASEIQSAYFNPAAIGMLDASGAQFTHSTWLADITYDYVAAAMTMGNAGNFFASVTALNSGEIDVRTVEQPLGTGEKYSVTDIAFGLGYGRQISDRFSIGLQVNYLQERIWHSAMDAFCLNVGTLYRISPDGLRIGASITNWGTRAKFDGRDLRILYDQNPAAFGDNRSLPAELFTNDYPLPILFRVGVGMPVAIGEDHEVFLAVDAFHPSDNSESVSMGAEWMFMKIFALRGGYQHLFQQDSEVGLTLGAGLQYSLDDIRLNLDYAWARFGRLDYAQRITLGVRF
jgi:hypothetical protein